MAHLAHVEHSQPKGGTNAQKSQRHRNHERKILEIEQLVKSAHKLDGKLITMNNAASKCS